MDNNPCGSMQIINVEDIINIEFHEILHRLHPTQFPSPGFCGCNKI
jgi:hypothetical protein